MGRPTKPTVVKKAQGTLRADRTVDEPDLPPEIPAPPEHLSEPARAFWNAYGPLLFDMRVLSKADWAALEQLCEAHAEIIEIRRRIRELGGTVYETVSGASFDEDSGTAIGGTVMRRPHPEVSQLSDLTRQLRGWLSDFGLTPASRSKVSKIVERKASKFDKLGPIPINRGA